MNKLIISIVILSQVWGCSAALKARRSASPLLQDGHSLWNLTVGRGDSQLFAGLLAMRKSGSMIEAALMDSTGIKLLEESVAADGEVKVVSALPTVRERRLPTLLGEGIHRLFFNGTGFVQEPCRQQWLTQLCFGERKDGSLAKTKKVGPLVLWRAHYSINNEGPVDVLAGASLRTSWFSPHLHFERRGIQ